MSANTCPGCQQKLPSQANFCYYCGTKVSSATIMVGQKKDNSVLAGWLVPLEEPHISIKLMGKENNIGKSSECSINLSMHLSQSALESISRRHAKVLLDEHKLGLIDLESTNFTFVNGQKITPYERVELPDNAHIRLGKTEFRFKRFGQKNQ